MGSESLRPKAEDFPTTHAPGDFLVSFASLQKKLAAAAAKPLFCVKDISPSADGDLLCPRRQSRQNAAGGNGFWERPAAVASVFQEPFLPDPHFYEGTLLKVLWSRPARVPSGRLVETYSLPLSSVDEKCLSTCFKAPKFPNIHRG